MKYKIRHFQSWIYIAAVICILLAFWLALLIAYGLMKWLLFADIVLFFLLILFGLVEQLVGTKVFVEPNIITISYLFNKRMIPVDEICNMETKFYYSTMYRSDLMKLTINLYDGRKVVLYDKAQKPGISLIVPEKLNKTDIPLYKAYSMIDSMICSH